MTPSPEAKAAWMAIAMEYARKILPDWTEDELRNVVDSVYDNHDFDDISDASQAMADEFDCWEE